MKDKLTYCCSRKMTTNWSAEIWSLKAMVGRISVCAWLCKFSASIVLCWLLCVSFISIMKLIMEQTIIVRVLVFIYLVSVVLTISNVFHWKRSYLFWVQISYKILVDAAPRYFASALYLDYGRHGLFHDFPVKNSFNLNGKTFQINL